MDAIMTKSSWLWLIVFFNCVMMGNCRCPPLSFVAHGIMRKMGPMKLRVVCDPGFQYYSAKKPNDDTGFVYCRNGQWSEPKPQCYFPSESCEILSPIENGEILQPPPYTDGAVVEYKCNTGFILESGSQERRCQKNLEWTGEEPKCVEYDPHSIEGIAKHIDTQFVDKMEQYSTGVGRSIDVDVELNGLDLILLFDKSSSIKPKEFKEGINFTKFLVEKFNVSNGDKSKVGGTRLAVVTFANTAKIEFSLDDKAVDSVEAAKRILDSIRCEGNTCDGGTNLADALVVVVQIIKNKARPDAKKALFITSDGTPTQGLSKNQPEFYIDKIKELETEVFAVGIGDDVDEPLLERLASDPTIQHVFLLKNFEGFSDIVTIIREKELPKPPPKLEKCGHRSEIGQKMNLEGNRQVYAGSWPWLAAIITANQETGEVKFACSGVLICRQWVVTNAACLHKNGQVLNSDDVYVILGEDNLDTENRREQYFYAKEIIIHNKFNANKSSDRDIGLIMLSEEASLNEYVRTACVPARDEYLSAQTDMPGIAVGWLTTSEEIVRIRDLPLPVAHSAQVTLRLLGSEVCDSVRPKRIDCRHLIVAGNSGLHSKQCSGEIGTPFHRTDNEGRLIVLGIAAHTEGCVLESKMMIFVPLGIHDDWIRDKTDMCTDQHI